MPVFYGKFYDIFLQCRFMEGEVEIVDLPMTQNSTESFNWI